MNTRLIGFTFSGDAKPHLRLERFGRRVDVPLPEETLVAIRSACFTALPKAARATTGDIVSSGFKIGTSSTCTVEVALQHTMAFALSKVLSNFVPTSRFLRVLSKLLPKSWANRHLILSKEETEQLRELGSLLKRSAEIAREDWESLA